MSSGRRRTGLAAERHRIRTERQAAAPNGTGLLAVSDTLAAVAAQQRGVLSRTQLAHLGFSPAQVTAAIEAHRWRALGRRVVVLHNGDLTADQQQWAAVLMPGKVAALAGLSAATAAGLRGFEPEQVHVVVAHATEADLPAWVRIHESRRFRSSDIARASAPPRTAAPRALVDAATWSEWPRLACSILCAGVQQRLTTPTLLEQALRRAGHVRHVAILRDVLGDISGGGHTLAEISFAPLAAAAGLPRPRRQVLRPDHRGRKRYVDIEIDLPDGTVLCVEIDGAAHMQHVEWCADADRQNELVIAGRPVLRYPSTVVRLEKHRVIDQLIRMRVAHARP